MNYDKLISKLIKDKDLTTNVYYWIGEIAAEYFINGASVRPDGDGYGPEFAMNASEYLDAFSNDRPLWGAWVSELVNAALETPPHDVEERVLREAEEIVRRNPADYLDNFEMAAWVEGAEDLTPDEIVQVFPVEDWEMEDYDAAELLAGYWNEWVSSEFDPETALEYAERALP